MPTTAQEQSHLLTYLTELFPVALAAVAREGRQRHPQLYLNGHLDADEGIVLQPYLLTTRNPAIRRMTETEATLFSAALCWTILLDEGAYTWYRGGYDAFRAVTFFPKLVGDCPGACHCHLHPTTALELVGGDAGNWLHNRIQRRSMVSQLAPMVQHLVNGLAASHRMPWLPDLFVRAVTELDGPHVPAPSAVHSLADLFGETRWQMPRITKDEFGREFAEAREQHRQRRAERWDPTPGRPSRPTDGGRPES